MSAKASAMAAQLASPASASAGAEAIRKRNGIAQLAAA